MPLFIYTNNVEDNIKTIKEYTKKDIIAVVKSDAYGLGSDKIIETLKKAKVQFFAFEKYLEYSKCRNQLVNQKVLIMESVSTNIMENEENNNVRFSINNYVDYLNVKKVTHQLNIHLRVDTGMNRFGIRNVDEFKKIILALQKDEKHYIEGLYTHFSSTNFESNYYEKQYDNFQKYTNLYKFPIIHANATKSLHKRIVGNFVRVGMAMYGYHQPVLKLKSTVSYNTKPVNIFKVSSPSKVGYMQKGTNKIIGVLPIGYNEIDLSTVKKIKLQNHNAYNQNYLLFGKSCMNHTHFIADEEINYLSWLSILPNNGIILGSDDNVFPRQENWYKILTSMKSLPKTYVRSKNYDLPKIFNYRGEKSLRTRFRKRGCKIINFRTF